MRRSQAASASVLTPVCAGKHQQGHLYGTDLPARDKAALSEYMKTLFGEKSSQKSSLASQVRPVAHKLWFRSHRFFMITNATYRDTPSIIHDEITTVRTGQRLTYSELTGPEKCDYLFNAGIRPTAYENYQGETRPEVFSGIVQFSKSALESIANHLLSQSLTRVGDELEVPKPKLFHTYGTTAKIRLASAACGAAPGTSRRHRFPVFPDRRDAVAVSCCNLS